MQYEFLNKLSRIINSGQSKSVVLTGNIQDLFAFNENYIPLCEFIRKKYSINNIKNLIYNSNGKLELYSSNDNVNEIKDYLDANKIKNTDDIILNINSNTIYALEFIVSYLKSNNNVILTIESADLFFPENGSNLSSEDKRKIGILLDLLCDSWFLNGHNTIIFICESKSLLNNRISKLPQLIEVNIESPNEDSRRNFKKSFLKKWQFKDDIVLEDEIVKNTAGLSIFALRQFLSEIEYLNMDLSQVRNSLTKKVESYIRSQLGEDVVDFYKPKHKLENVYGFKNLKKFFNEEMIPRIKVTDDTALVGAVVAGPIGVGKTFICEAIASELEFPVLLLKNIRSQWFGQTDVIFERLKRVLEALGKVIIFIDEADTQFGNINNNAHETEKRLTGKLQQMMSDSTLKGKVTWLLMTARINLLSADIRRPGRAGDLIIPILDPIDEEDVNEFRQSILSLIDKTTQGNNEIDEFNKLTTKLSAASWASLRSRVKYSKDKTLLNLIQIVKDTLEPDIKVVRRYQELQALLNCTRLSLLPEVYRKDIVNHRKLWEKEIKELECKII